MASLKMTKTTPNENETLHVSLASRRVKGQVNVYSYIDKDTKQYVGYCKSLDLTAYGETMQKMHEMMQFAMKDFFKFLIELPTKKREQELFNLGWKHQKLRTKDFSCAFVDVSGELQNFAEPKTVSLDAIPF